MTTTRARRRNTDPAIEWIRRSDPLAGHPPTAWSHTDEAVRMLGRITAGERTGDPTSIFMPARRRFTRPLLVAAALLVIGAGAAGAKLLLGGPAPSAVKRDIGAVDQGMPADLRLDPDVENARLVAQSDGARLYAADLTGGGYCAEIVEPDGRQAGAVCTAADALAREPVGVSVPFVDPVTIESPFIVGGRVNVAGVTSLEAVFADGSGQAVTIGDGGFYVFAVSDEHLADAHRHGLSLVATDVAGAEVATTTVPATDFTSPEDHDANQPIFVSTISTQNDFTKVLGIEGRVNVAGAVLLELRYPDGAIVDVPLDPHGRFHYDLPPARQDDLFARPGELVARDAHRNELAVQPVAAVAFWRAQG
jgi:hypothetical protein